MIYSLLDQAGVLACSMAMAAGGVPVQRTDDGRLVYPAGSIGEVSMRPAAGALEVSFGGETQLHEKLELAKGDAEAFETAALGRYASDDADTIAVIERDGDKLAISQSDGLGRVRAPLIPLSPAVAYSRPSGANAAFRTTISLDVEDGEATGFRLNTARTRNLEFRRM